MYVCVCVCVRVCMLIEVNKKPCSRILARLDSRKIRASCTEPGHLITISVTILSALHTA